MTWQKWIRDPATMHTILLGRGCPFECTYCCNRTLRKLAPGKYVRLRSPDNVIEELATLVRDFPDAKEVYFEIETFAVNMDFALGLCARLQQFQRQHEQELSFGANVRVTRNCDYTQLFQAMKDANFALINMGLESGSERIRKEILGRHYSNADILRAVRLAKKHGFRVDMGVMVGMPGESMHDFKRTVECVKQCQPDITSLSIFFPYPGTALHQVCKERGLLDHKLPTERERQFAVLDLPGFSKKQIQREYDWFPYKISKGKKLRYDSLKVVIHRRILTTYRWLLPLCRCFSFARGVLRGRARLLRHGNERSPDAQERPQAPKHHWTGCYSSVARPSTTEGRKVTMASAAQQSSDRPQGSAIPVRSALPRILVMGPVLPGSRDGGGVVQDEILRRYPRDRYVCFATEPLDTSQLAGQSPASLRGVPCLVGPIVPRLSIPGARFYLPLLRAFGLRLIAPLRVSELVSFGRRHAVELVWAVLQDDAVVLAKRVAEGLGVPLVGTIFDDPDGWLADGGYDRPSRRLLQRRFREALKCARLLSTAGEAMQSAYEKEHGVRSVILRHGFDEPAPPTPRSTGTDGITIGFVGSAYGRDAWTAFLSAAARLNASGRFPTIRLRVFGGGPFSYSHEDVQIDVRGWQPADVMLREIAATDFCYLPYWFDPAKRRHVELSFPNKFETYMAAGRPVLFHGPQYAGVAEAVREHGVGLCVHSQDGDEITNALERLVGDKSLRDSLGRAALAAFRAEFNAATMMNQFAELIGVEPELLRGARTAGDNARPLPRAAKSRRRKFLFCSPLAIEPTFLRVAEIVAREHDLEGHVLAPEEFSGRIVHHPSGKLSRGDFDPSSTPLRVHFLPARKGNLGRFGFQAKAWKALLREIDPDYVWIHAEFWEGIARQFLWRYRFKRRPRIVAYIATNQLEGRAPLLSPKWPFFSRSRLAQAFLWPRLDAVATCATAAMQCARRIGLPQRVPAVTNYLPVLGPEDATEEGAALPWQQDGAFTIGFVGVLGEQKGWKVLLAALQRLPERFRTVIVGDGEQKDELLQRLREPTLERRAHYAGPLPKERLLATYPSFDVLVLPSVTCHPSPEQFGCVLAEAMACGVPVIGSDSGAIPETIGDAGLIVPEGDAGALAGAILRMSEDGDLRRRLVERGLEKYRTSYNCEAYARSIATLLGIIPQVTHSDSHRGKRGSNGNET